MTLASVVLFSACGPAYQPTPKQQSVLHSETHARWPEQAPLIPTSTPTPTPTPTLTATDLVPEIRIDYFPPIILATPTPTPTPAPTFGISMVDNVLVETMLPSSNPTKPRCVSPGIETFYYAGSLNSPNCGFSYSGGYPANVQRHCRINFSLPNTNYAVAGSAEFYTNCLSCLEGALHATDSYEGAINASSDLRCTQGKALVHSQYRTKYSFTVDTIADATGSCSEPTRYFSYELRDCRN